MFQLCLFFVSPQLLAQSKWQEDTHYKVIAEQASSSPQVREVFSYWCPACNAFETLVPQIKQGLPANVPFRKVHVNFNGSTNKATQDAATAAMLAAKALKVSENFNKTLFTAIHQQRKKLSSKADILAIYAEAGGDTAKLEKMMNSFGIRSQIAQNDKLTTGVRSVPTVIVNDKFQPIFTRIMKPEEYIELINWLLKQK